VRTLTQLILIGATFSAAHPVRAQDADAAGRRIADVASIAAAEYAEGVIDGAVVRPDEYEEATLFLAEARRTAESLPVDVRDRVTPHLDAMAAMQRELVAAARLDERLQLLRTTLESALGIPLDPLPDGAPTLAVGRAVYDASCAQCHGPGGAGDGPAAPGLDPAPADLADAEALRAVPPVEFYRKINVGVAGTAMPGFESSLTLEERWAVTLYASSLRHAGDAAAGRTLLEAECAECGERLGDLASTAHVTDDSLAAILTALGGPPVVARMEDAVAYARVAAAAEHWGADRVLAIRRAIRATTVAVERAVALADDGRWDEASRGVLDAYLEFERIESAMRAQDAGAVRSVEQAFADLRMATASPDASAGLPAAHEAVLAALAAVDGGAARSMAVGAFFFQSFVILVREGLEAILIVGALVAFLVKSGAPERRRDIGLGVGWALVASLAVAVGFATIFRAAVAHQEVLEGITMLLAAAVLFAVSYWLVSKVEVQKWNAFVRARMTHAMNSGRAWALAGVAFLAVFREGVETVLFYAALIATGEGRAAAVAAIAAGFVAGTAVLVVIYLGIQRWGLRIPLRPFFAVTSALLYLMAFSFAGQGIAELQEVGWIGMTPLQWIPVVPALGIFPTMQTVLGQAVLALALVGALIWVFVVSPRPEQARASA
jgi:high-affinity iron transporter